ncbi:helix-turn-helix transcriptional regulator [Kibdelosporangium phytohabitans]|uniref:XRE family transcriptional regulator n=1 Tax=Kibdelosporangium phytohabitans TaxID=860235 RepID=A0A0N9I1K2_9PSEU|nr:helix-turn-helix transcriptional regulator [Kibdelosporangium phytohabitans]ALG08313.1 XRE family transcriptional regulator [Kibdelosporangium phytohabitans]MBE1470660.1 transcriptional regulator with XRE-family HTH domain [Kibdelosporangium phytohabitans]
MASGELGAFLRARRAQRSPEDAGVLYAGRRKVTGLRREEVAVLAGVNADYYTRLEQGRETHPSPQVLDALCRALDLGPDAREHLYRLAGTTPDNTPTPTPQAVSPELRQLMDGYPHTPAFVLNRILDVLATNTLADALFSPFRVADNLARMTFLDPAGQRFYARWDWTAQATVANLRVAAGFDAHDPGLRRLVAELSEGSAHFRTLWETHQVRGKTREPKHLVHPDVGPLTLTYQAFDVRSAPGQQLIIYHAGPATPSAHALALLSSLHATEHHAR